VAVVAVGGYGRGEVSPHSDVDLLILVDDKRRPSPEDLRGLLYPLWDAGFQVGHAVCSPREAIERARGDLEAATSLLGARLVAGPVGLMDEMTGRRRRWLERDGRRLARRLLEVTAERHLRVERAGWVAPAAPAWSAAWSRAASAWRTACWSSTQPTTSRPTPTPTPRPILTSRCCWPCGCWPPGRAPGARSRGPA